MADLNVNANGLFASPDGSQPKATKSNKKGKLKIFIGICPGVGKTYAMLQAAHAQAADGVQVIVNCDARLSPETNTLLEGLMTVPMKKVEYRDVLFDVIDTEAILDLHPQLVVVPDLARSNPPFCEHKNRYGHVLELLEDGIDVYSTLNIVHMESLRSTVALVTGLNVVQSLPDEVLEQADQLELIDIPTEQLISRFIEGKIYVYGHPHQVMANFFRRDKLIALREIALRIISMKQNRQNPALPSYHSRQHFLAVMWHPDCKNLILKTKAIADEAQANWSALYVDFSGALNERENSMLSENFELIRQLGGNSILYPGNDPAAICREVVHRENISIIIIESLTHKNYIANRKNRGIINRLVKNRGEADMYIITEESPAGKKHDFGKRRLVEPYFRYDTFAVTALVSILTAILCFLLIHNTGEKYIPLFMIFVLLVIAIILRMGLTLLFILLTSLVASFLFIPPQGSFGVTIAQDDLPAIIIFFIIALVCGVLTSKFRAQQLRAVYRSEEAHSLFMLARKLGNATSLEEVVEKSRESIRNRFSADVSFLFQDNDTRLMDSKIAPDGIELTSPDIEAAEWAFKHDRMAGRFTGAFPSAQYTYYPVKGPGIRLGVIAVRQQSAFTGRNAIAWDTFMEQIARSIEFQYLGQIARRSAMLDESDKLYKTLFNSISHELRIPLASIMGASDILRSANHPESIRTELYDQIFDSSKRLDRLINNLLNMSRLESGRIAPHPAWCDIRDVVSRVSENLVDEFAHFRIRVEIPDSMPLVKLDAGLTEQILYNLAYNSCLYAPRGAEISLEITCDDGMLIMEHCDTGPGFNEETLSQVFDKFWRPSDSLAGGLGLGLSIVKGFTEAQCGTVSVENSPGGGACFTIKIPVVTANPIPYEQ